MFGVMVMVRVNTTRNINPDPGVSLEFHVAGITTVVGSTL